MKPRSLRFYLGLLALGLLVPLVHFAAGAVNRFAASQREARAQGMRETARVLDAGFDEHLVKPVDLTRLRELLLPRKRAVPAHST
ncbi:MULTISPECIES: hypothetical protein [Myxococcus]|uniref:hypothetical protein n=1 Tax=Myxococcus TaxID=32 RepID=UPI001E445E2A|nr:MULTISPECIES: hypothetical protein [Myxococcus]